MLLLGPFPPALPEQLYPNVGGAGVIATPSRKRDANATQTLTGTKSPACIHAHHSEIIDACTANRHTSPPIAILSQFYKEKATVQGQQLEDFAPFSIKLPCAHGVGDRVGVREGS